MLDEPGHDPATGLMYVTSEAYPLTVPSAPTVEQALDALAKLWHPVRLFPFADGSVPAQAVAQQIPAAR